MVMLNAVLFTVLWTLCVSDSSEIVQPEHFKTAKLGETVQIKCLTKSMWRGRVWHKLEDNGSLTLLSWTGRVEETRVENHYSVKTSPDETILTIKRMRTEDVGTYYCGILNSFNVLFGSGTVLELEGDSKPVQTELHSPDYIRVQPGDSVTLTCSFNTSFSPQEHVSVTWIKNSASEIISWKDITKITCGINTTTGETVCAHNWTLNNVSSAEDGTYLCLVTACGRTWIGTGTRIHVQDGLSERSDLSPTVLVLIVLNVVFFAAVVVLAWVVHCYRKNQQTAADCLGSAHGEQTEGEVTYAGVNMMPWSASCRSTSVTTREVVVYSEVRKQHD
ncbi:hypothetical protein WMY93_017255 [Mugilogobius chulae]|uniref:Ig-like domain-containing protein n=1 Tax=Mugilogobius chulae TaxID=88201 RepID=A0AAW0NNV7_9GOBI